MNFFNLLLLAILFLMPGCNDESAKNTKKDLIVDHLGSIDVLFDDCFSLVEHHLNEKSDINDPYFEMNLPNDVFIDDAIIEISIKVEGVSGHLVVNGITPEAYTIKDRVFRVKSHQKDKHIKGKKVTIFIKENHGCPVN